MQTRHSRNTSPYIQYRRLSRTTAAQGGPERPYHALAQPRPRTRTLSRPILSSHLKLHHDAASSGSRVLNLAPVLWLAVNGEVLQQSPFYPMALTIPVEYTLVNADEG
jgi:hypothetical protein